MANLVRMALGRIRRQEPARLLVWFSVLGLAGWLAFRAVPDGAVWIPLAIPLYFLTLISKCIVLLALPVAIADSVLRHRDNGKTLRLAVIWGIAVFLLISLLALGRQQLIWLVNNDSVRYVPAAGNTPGMGLEYVTWPPEGSGPSWTDGKSPLVKLYPRMWHSGQIYWHELLLALLMIGAWLSVGRIARQRWHAVLLVAVFSVAVLVLGQMVNHYFIWDYDFFLLGIWSDSVLMELAFAIFPGATSVLFFLFALAIAVSSLGAARLSALPANPPTSSA